MFFGTHESTHLNIFRQISSPNSLEFLTLELTQVSTFNIYHSWLKGHRRNQLNHILFKDKFRWPLQSCFISKKVVEIIFICLCTSFGPLWSQSPVWSFYCRILQSEMIKHEIRVLHHMCQGLSCHCLLGINPTLNDLNPNISPENQWLEKHISFQILVPRLGTFVNFSRG